MEHCMSMNHSRSFLLALSSGLLAFAPGALAQTATPTAVQTAAPVKPVDAKPIVKPAEIQPATKPTDAKPATGEKLPTGKEVLAKFLEATGTAKAREAIKNRVVTGTIKIEAQGVEGKFVNKLSGDGKLINTVDLAENGEMVRWTDGKTGGESQPGGQARVVSGEDLIDMKRNASLFPESTPDAFFKAVDVIGVEAIDGKDCYKVETTSLDGGKRLWYYSKDTGLLVKWSAEKKRGGMELKTETMVSDWKEIDGVKIPMTQTQANHFGEMRLEIVIHNDKVEHNVKLGDADFAMPEALKEALESDKKAPAKEDKKPDTK
jgi:hypothetical protein